MSNATVSPTLPWEKSGQGRPLVLVPGGLTGWISWVPIAERLAATRTVVRVQLLNVQLGLDGAALPADYSPATEVAALGRALDAAGLTSPVDLAAWSYGGGVALEFALDRPHRVRTLTLIEPGGPNYLPTLDAEARRVRDSEMQVPRDHVAEEDLERFLGESGLVPPGSDPRKLDQWPMWSRHRQSLRALPSMWEYAADPGRLPGFPRPVLLIKGAGSAAMLHQTVDHLGGQLPDARVLELPGGHAAHLASMDAFLEAMASFQDGAR